MKFAMVTPISIHSAIAKNTQGVVEVMKKLGHRVVVVNAEVESGSSEVFPFGIDAVHWAASEKVQKRLHQADVVVYQLGEGYPFHAGCLAWMPSHPGLVILPDFFVATESMISAAKAVITHSRSDIDQLCQTCVGPVAYIPLASCADDHDEAHAQHVERYTDDLIDVAKQMLVCAPIEKAIQAVVSPLKQWEVEINSSIAQAVLKPIQAIT